MVASRTWAATVTRFQDEGYFVTSYRFIVSGFAWVSSLHSYILFYLSFLDSLSLYLYLAIEQLCRQKSQAVVSP